MLRCRASLVKFLVCLFVLAAAKPALPAATDGRVFFRKGASGEVALSPSADGPWTIVRPGNRFQGYTVQCLCTDPGSPRVVLERESDTGGEIRYVGPGGQSTVIGKVFGTVGRQPPPAIIERSQDEWQRLLKAPNDILGERYLADPADPSYARTKQLVAPLQFPESYVGMREYPHEVHVSWDGSIGLDPGFFTGQEWNTREFATALPFALNGREIDPAESLRILRGQLEHFLPVVQYLLQRAEDQVGWEQIVFMGRIGQTAGLFLRFRLANFGAKAQTVSFSIPRPVGGDIKVLSDRISITAPFPTPGPMPNDPKAAARKQRQIDQKVFSALMLASELPSQENGLPVWRFDLDAGQTKDLYLLLPGYSASGPLPVTRDGIKPAFYRALKAQHDGWHAFFDRGMQLEIPEPMVTEVYRGVTAKVLV